MNSPTPPPSPSAPGLDHQQNPKRKAWVYVLGYLTSAIVGIGGGLIGLHYINKDKGLYRELASIPLGVSVQIGQQDLKEISSTKCTVQDVLFIRDNGETICGTTDQCGQRGLLFSRSTLQMSTQVYAKKVDTVYLTIDKPIRYVPAEQLRGKAIPPRVQAQAVFIHIPDAMLVKLRVDAGLDPDLNGPLVNWEAKAKRDQEEREAKLKAAEEEREAKQKKIQEEQDARYAKSVAANTEALRKRDEAKQLQAAAIAAEAERVQQMKIDDDKASREELIAGICANLSERAEDLEKVVLRDDGKVYDKYSVPKEFAGACSGIVEDIDMIDKLAASADAKERITSSRGWERYTSAVVVFRDVYGESRKKLDKWNNGGAQALANMSAEKRKQEAEQSARIRRNLDLNAQRRARERAEAQQERKGKGSPDAHTVRLGVPRSPGMPEDPVTRTPPGMPPGMPPGR